jgi:predicted MPP superfamily phosphohydrolase
MRILFPLIFSAVFILLIGGIQLLLLRFLTRAWWDRKIIRWAAVFLPLFGVMMVIVWGFGEYYTRDWLTYPGAVAAALTFVLEVALMLSLPLSGVLHFAQRIADLIAHRRRKESSDTVNTGRRDFLRLAATGLPVTAVATGVSGITGAFSDVKVERKVICFDNLPEGLESLRILHLSDLHLMHYVTVDDLAAVLAEAKILQPHLVLLTGDVADDLRLLPDTLDMLEAFAAPLGAFACLGNHEYFRGVGRVRRIFDSSPVPLLVDQAVKLQFGSTSFYVGGIDDPRLMGAKDYAFFRRTIDATLEQAGTGAFSVLMSHRPDALDYASEVGVDLTLAGHTHGGQIGLGGRSLFESAWPDRYLWGHYQRRGSHLYTSSGVGHWFPFRLGCPREAPVIELARA